MEAPYLAQSAHYKGWIRRESGRWYPSPMLRIITLLSIGILATRAFAGDVSVAVAANFAAPMQRIAVAFEQETGHRVRLSSGASGKFYAQIINGAPFEVLLSADDELPALLEREGQAVSGTRFTYAIGRLVLWSSDPRRVDAAGEILRHRDLRRVAVANPKTAPYGTAAFEVMRALKLLDALQPRLIQGENIAQTYQFVASGNAEIGFVARSQVWKDGRLADGSGWLVPESLHAPIRQDAILLVRGRDNPAASALLNFLRSEPIRRQIRSNGYDL